MVAAGERAEIVNWREGLISPAVLASATNSIRKDTVDTSFQGMPGSSSYQMPDT